MAVMLIAAATVAVAAGQNSIYFAGWPVFAITVALAFLIQWLVFIHAFAKQTERFFDLTGSFTYLTVAATALVLGNGNTRSLLIAVLVSIWAIRLGAFLFSRIRRQGDDRRFRSVKPDFPAFLMTWTLQGFWVSMTLAAGLAAMTSQSSADLDLFAGLGFALWLAGFSIEAKADSQKRAFRANPGNRNKFIQSGLWRWSRHPNYFGEIVLWLGIALIALPALSGWQLVTLISPVFVWLLLTRVSGIRMLEALADKQWADDPEYQAYKSRTPSLFPAVPTPEAMHPFRFVIGTVSFGFIVINLTMWSLVVAVLMLTRLVLPGGRRLINRSLTRVYRMAVCCDDWWLKQVLGIRWQSPQLNLDPNCTYIVLANHRSWIDIFLIQSAIARKGPVIRFLTKRELAYIPVLGLIFVAFDFPLLKRRARRNVTEAERRREDRHRILEACAAIKDSSGALVSFAEGTRFTDDKHATRQGYRHLLPPRAGGFSALCEGLRGHATAVIDLTLIYPEHANFWQFLGGAVPELYIHGITVPIEALADTDAGDWLNERWVIKDDIIEQALQAEVAS
jgi:steroid 5-alpha reductase family enzyme/1-acyl-sn-glycerol-3-phosphate acyltransferase